MAMKRLTLFLTLFLASAWASNFQTPVQVGNDLYYIFAFVGANACDPSVGSYQCPVETTYYADVRIYQVVNHGLVYKKTYNTECFTVGCTGDDYPMWVTRALSGR